MLFVPLALGLVIQVNDLSPRPVSRSLTQLSLYGTQVNTTPTQKSESVWHIKNSQALEWNGTEHTYFGINSNGDISDLKADYEIGYRNFCLDIPVSGPQWKVAIPWLTKHKCRYFIKIISSAPQVHGYPVDPVGYRIPNVTEDTKLKLPMPGVEKTFWLSAVERDGTVEQSAFANVKYGVLKLEVKPLNDLAHVVLFYPLTTSLQIPDLWVGADQQRDLLLKSLLMIKDKSYLRGIIDPFGKLVTIPKPNLHFVPSSHAYREEFASFLRNKYHGLNELFRTWSMLAPDQTSFRQVARLIPLWVKAKGPRQLLDPKTGHLYQVSSSPSATWSDIQTMLNGTLARRYERLTAIIHKIVDIPVFQSWKGWGVPYEHGIEVDGIAFKCSGHSPLKLLHFAVRAESSALRSGKPVATIADNYKPSNLTKGELVSSIQDLLSLNASAVFLNSSNAEEKSQFLQETKSLSGSSEVPIQALYFPESATNPAQAQRLGGGEWWLPSPIDGNRLELGSHILGYEMKNHGVTDYVLWSASESIKESFDAPVSKNIRVTSSSPVALNLKLSKSGFSLNLPSLPVEIEGLTAPPSPVTLYGESLAEFHNLMAYRKSLHQQSIETEINFNNSKDSYSRNPGVALLGMRKSLRKLAIQFGSFVWVPCSNPDKMIIGERVKDPSAISTKVWEVRSDLSLSGSTQTINYTVMPKSTQVTTLWLAAKITPSELKQVHVRIGHQIFGLVGPAMGSYGTGYGWYKIGKVSLAGQSTISVDIDGSQPFSVRLDAFVLTPTDFAPNGTRLPQTPEELASAVPSYLKNKTSHHHYTYK